MAAQFEITFTLGAQSVSRLSSSYSDENGDPLPDTPQNRAASFRSWADAIFAGTKANVLRWEKQEAAQAAQNVVPDIDPA